MNTTSGGKDVKAGILTSLMLFWLAGRLGALIFAFEADFGLDQIKSGGLVDLKYEKGGVTVQV